MSYLVYNIKTIALAWKWIWSSSIYRWKLWVCYKLSRNQPTGLFFHHFAMIQTCTYLYSSN